MTGQRLPLDFVVRRHIDTKRFWSRIVDEVVADPVRPPGLAEFRSKPTQTALEGRARQHVAGGSMIRMPIVPVRERDRSRTRAPNQSNDILDLLIGAADCTVRPTEILPPLGAQDRPRSLRFGLPFFRRAVRSQLPSRQVAQTDAKPEG